MQTDRNRICDYVVLDSVNMASGDKDIILDQIYEKANMMILDFIITYENAYLL